MNSPAHRSAPLVYTLDAGGTNFVFSAMQAGKPVGEPVCLPACPDDLDACLNLLVTGFRALEGCPDAISFAFPGPADYEHGVIGDLPNFAAFRGGVPLGPFLAGEFGVPVHIHNDGNLFALGEAVAGFLPALNRDLKAHGRDRTYRHLIGVTLGTGLGAGVVVDGRMLTGDNGLAAEVWLCPNTDLPGACAMESVGRDPLRQTYAELAGTALEDVPDPIGIEEIARGLRPGDREAAAGAYRRFGRVLGSAVATVIAIVDAPVVLGGGLAAARELFLPSFLEELRRPLTGRLYGGTRRLIQEVFDLDTDAEREAFLAIDSTPCSLPGSGAAFSWRSRPALGVGVTRLGTSQAVALGAYSVACQGLM